MASPASDSYSGRKNAKIIGGKLLRKNVITAPCTQANMVSDAAVSSSTGSTHSITVANVYQTNLVSSAYLLGPVIEAGEWQQLTIASHSRYIPVAQDTTATDSATTVTATYLPGKLWQTPFLSSDGKLYYFGGMHSDYPGNDIDVCDLSAISGSVMTWQQLARPHVPPSGDSGYGSGGSLNLYRNYSPALSDKTEWQPYARHYYCGALIHPVHGLLLNTGYPVNPANGLYSTTTWDGSGYPVGSSSYWSDGRGFGITKYIESTNKYELFAAGNVEQSLASEWHLSDYSSMIDGFLIFDTANSSITEIYECSYRTSNAITYKYDVSSTDSGLVGNAATRQEGTVVRWMYGWKWIVLHKNGDTGFQTLKIYDHTDGLADSARFVNVSLPSGVTAISGGNFAIALDRSGNRIFFCELTSGGTPNFWVSTFDSPGTWSSISATNTPSVSYPYGSVTAAIGREILIYWNNQLFLIGFSNTNTSWGSLVFYRVVLDGGVTP